jgi:MFS family permease
MLCLPRCHLAHRHRLYGLQEDLGLSSQQFQVIVSILFVTYLLFEVPSNLVLKKLRPSRWIGFITTSWGIIATLSGITQNYGGMIACRLLLGAVESGLFPGMAVYLTLFYTKKELAKRIGYLFVSAAIAGACGGLLAFGIGHMDGASHSILLSSLFSLNQATQPPSRSRGTEGLALDLDN